MNSRIIATAIRHSLFASGTAAAYMLYDNYLGKKIKDETKFLPTTSDEDCNNGLIWKRDKAIISQAFKDAGWQRPVYVAYRQEETGVFTANNAEGIFSAYVKINNKDIPYSSSRDLDLYAIMGHEAIHAVYGDDKLKAFAYGFTLYAAAFAGFRTVTALNLHKLWMRPMAYLPESSLGLFLLLMTGVPQIYFGLTTYSISYILFNTATIATLPLARYHEKRADKQSAMLLGTANIMADLLEQRSDKVENDFLNPHPALAVRVDYLRKLAAESAYTPKLFQSLTYRKLGKSEPLESCSCKDNDRISFGGAVLPA